MIADAVVRRFYAQLDRVHAVTRIFARNRFPARLDYLQAAVNDETGMEWCSRTIRRDLEFLESLQVVEQEPIGWKLRRDAWRMYVAGQEAHA